MKEEVLELGACQAVLSGISTRVDGSVTIKLEINPEDQDLINRLMNCYLAGMKVFTVGFVREA